jgi:hypothetical protein
MIAIRLGVFQMWTMPSRRSFHAEPREQAGAGQRAGDARGVGGDARHPHGASQLFARHGVGDQRGAQAQVGRPHQAHQADHDQHDDGIERAGEGERHQRGRDGGIAEPHAGQEVARADAVAHDAEDRRDQRAAMLQGAEQRQQHDRAGLDQHVPAENQELHFQRPRRQQVGGPLEAVAARLERRERRLHRKAEPGRQVECAVQHKRGAQRVSRAS